MFYKALHGCLNLLALTSLVLVLVYLFVCIRATDKVANNLQNSTSTASLLVATYEKILQIPLDGQNKEEVIETYEFNRGVDFDFKTGTLIWFKYHIGNIFTRLINASSTETKFVENEGSEIIGMAFDWVHDLIYWTDLQKKEICVSNFNGTMKKVLITDDGISNPTSIVVNPLNGWMHWVDEGLSQIERAAMDGSRREVIYKSNGSRPSSLTIDFLENRLYWTQGESPSSIFSSNFDGSDRKLVLTGHGSEFEEGSWFQSISIFEDDIYLVDYPSTIYKENKYNGSNLVVVLKSESNINDVKVFDASKQLEGENKCEGRIAKCSHFCVPVPSPADGNSNSDSTACACPDKLNLVDGQNCI